MNVRELRRQLAMMEDATEVMIDKGTHLSPGLQARLGTIPIQLMVDNELLVKLKHVVIVS